MSKNTIPARQLREDLRTVRLHLNEAGRNALAEYAELWVRWECLLDSAVHKVLGIKEK